MLARISGQGRVAIGAIAGAIVVALVCIGFTGQLGPGSGQSSGGVPGDVPVVMTADPGPTLATQGTYSAPAGNVPVSNPISTVPATSDSVPSSVSVPMTTISAVVATTTSQQPTTTTATHHPKPPKPTPTTTTTVCVLLLC